MCDYVLTGNKKMEESLSGLDSFRGYYPQMEQ